MSHVVETGAGLSTANAYLTAAEFRAYWADHGAPAEVTGASDPDIEQAVRAGTQGLEVLYGNRYRGRRAHSAQALGWPRYGVADDDGWWVDAASLPQRLKDACAVISLEPLTGDGTTADVAPDVATPGALASLTETVGPLSRAQTWLGGRSLVKSRPVVAGLMRPLIVPGGTVIRA